MHIVEGACTETNHSKDLLCLKNSLLYTQTLFSNVVLNQAPIYSCHANVLLEDLPCVMLGSISEILRYFI